MASVHLALQRGSAGFNRVVAIKRLRPGLAEDTDFVVMMMDEARLGSRVSHPNVVTVLDVVEAQDEVALVLEYVHGESLARLLKIARESNEPMPTDVVAAILAGALRGLHHAHEAKDASGAPLGLVHRDISPQNILVDATGIAKVADFGIAKAQGRMQQTEIGQLKGKIAYMAPEQVYGNASRASDVFAMGVVAWEAFTTKRLFVGKTRNETAQAVLETKVGSPNAHGANLPAALERAVLAALDHDPARRPGSALELALAIEQSLRIADPSEVGDWVRRVSGESLRKREREIRELERRASGEASITPAEPSAQPPAPVRRSWFPAVLVVIGIGLALATGVWLGRSRPVELPEAEAVAAEPSVQRVAEPLAVIAPSSAPAPAASSVAERPDAGATSSATRPTRSGAPPPRSDPKRKTSCNPPTYIDAKGVTRYKPECF
jgi:serine/threonine-protein kinase